MDCMKNIKPCWRAFSRGELYVELGKGFFLCYLISFLFYDRIWLSLAFLFLWYPWLSYEELQNRKKEKKLLLEQLKEMLISVHNSIYAGYSLENALRLAKKDVRLSFGGKKGEIERQLDQLDVGLGMNVPLDQLLMAMAKKIRLEEMGQFVKVVCIVKRRGGNLVEILGQTIDHLNQKIQVKEEITTLISAKVLEQRIMSVMPFLILCYVRCSNPNYFDTLYSTVLGRIIATIALVVLGAAYVLGSKIIEIEV